MISPFPPPPDDRRGLGSRRRRGFRRLLALAVVALVAAGGWFAASEYRWPTGSERLETATATPAPDDTPAVNTALTTSSQDATTSTAGSASIATTATTGRVATTPAAPRITGAPPPRPDGAIWPRPGSPTRYRDPISAARTFVEDYLGFDKPRIGTYRFDAWAGGEVEFRPYRDGPVTIVVVDRDLRDDSWWVFGARSEQIIVDEPGNGAVLDDFIHVVGTTVAESGVLDVELRLDDERNPLLVADIPTGGGEDSQWFEGGFGWNERHHGSGAVLFLTRSPEDGRVVAAAVVRVHLTAGTLD